MRLNVVDLICILLLIYVVVKFAQIQQHTWSPEIHVVNPNFDKIYDLENSFHDGEWEVSFLIIFFS